MSIVRVRTYVMVIIAMDRPNTQNSSISGGGVGGPRRYHKFFFFLLSESLIGVVCL